MVIHLEMPFTDDESGVVDERYIKFKKVWKAIYPRTPAAYAYLDRVIVAVIKRKNLPPLKELTDLIGTPPTAGTFDPKTRFQGCFMHQHEASLCEAVKLLQSLGVSPTQGATP